MRDLTVRAGAGDPGQPPAPRRSGGGMRARGREAARGLLQLPLSLLLPPPEIARRACSSVDMRGGRAWLLLQPPRSAERGPTSEKGGRSGLREAGRCVCGVSADPVEQAWERAERGGWSWGSYSGNPAPRPSLQLESLAFSFSFSFFFFVWIKLGFWI